MTDTEILAGIDSLFISQQIASWIGHTKRMRLSQVLDMFYSARGIPILAIETTNHERRFKKKPVQQIVKKHYYNSEYVKPKNPYAEEIENFKPFQSETNGKLRAIFERPDTDLRRNRKHKYLSRFSVSDGITRACQRQAILDRIDKNKLKDETYFLSQVLQLSTSSLGVSDQQLRTNCDATVDRFFTYAGKISNSIKMLTTENVSNSIFF